MVFRLGPWIIDPSARQVSQRTDAIHPLPKAMAVLDVLVGARGAVASRSELLEKVWPHVTTGEEVLTQAVAELRRALGDKPQTPRFLETVHRAGYRLLLLPSGPSAR